MQTWAAAFTVSTLLFACLACGAGKAPPDGAARPPIPVDANQNPAPVVQPGDVPKSPACDLLSSEDIEAVQGEAVAESQGTVHRGGPLDSSQCFLRLPTCDKSISVEFIRANPDNPSRDALREYLRQKFERAQAEYEQERRREEEREKELERERAQGGVREGGNVEKEEEEREEKSPPKRVAGVGDEAFWARHNGTGALFVRRKDTAFSLTLSGPEDREAKIRKATALARRVLKRLSAEQKPKQGQR
jgi:hypothetical protein